MDGELVLDFLEHHPLLEVQDEHLAVVGADDQAALGEVLRDQRDAVFLQVPVVHLLHPQRVRAAQVEAPQVALEVRRHQVPRPLQTQAHADGPDVRQVLGLEGRLLAADFLEPHGVDDSAVADEGLGEDQDHHFVGAPEADVEQVGDVHGLPVLLVKAQVDPQEVDVQEKRVEAVLVLGQDQRAQVVERVQRVLVLPRANELQVVLEHVERADLPVAAHHQQHFPPHRPHVEPHEAHVHALGALVGRVWSGLPMYTWLRMSYISTPL